MGGARKQTKNRIVAARATRASAPYGLKERERASRSESLRIASITIS
jgi:hypothetical protein